MQKNRRLGWGRLLRGLPAATAVAALLLGSVTVSTAAADEQATPTCTTQDRAYTTTIFQDVSAVDPRQYPNRFRCLMREGATGSEVRALQSTLRRCYAQDIAFDGIFGPATRQALINAQRQIGVAADGVYGPNTAEALSFPSWRRTGGAWAGCLNIDLRIFGD